MHAQPIVVGSVGRGRWLCSTSPESIDWIVLFSACFLEDLTFAVDYSLPDEMQRSRLSAYIHGRK